MSKQRRIWLGFLPILLLAGVLIWWAWSIERCIYTTTILLTMTSLGFLFLFYIGNSIIQLVHIVKGNHSKLRLTVFLLSTILTGLAYSTYHYSFEFLRKPVVLKAEKGDGLDFVRLTLRKNNEFEVTLGIIDWSCTYVGKYEIKDDTLLLEKTKIESGFGSIYLIHESFLEPLDAIILPDSINWLKITEQK